MKYIIYHVFGVKIGCTKNYPERCYAQGYEDSQFEVLDQVSEGCGERFAGEVERFWQQYYGLKTDNLQYSVSVENSGFFDMSHEKRLEVSSLGGKRTGELGLSGFQTMSSKQKSFAGKVGGRRAGELGVTGFQTMTFEQKSLGGKIGGNHLNNPLKSGSASRGPNAANKKLVVCPWCGTEGKLPPMKRWHFDGCGLLKVFADNNAAIE